MQYGNSTTKRDFENLKEKIQIEKEMKLKQIKVIEEKLFERLNQWHELMAIPPKNRDEYYMSYLSRLINYSKNQYAKFCL